MAKTVNYIGLMSGTSLDGVDAVIVDERCKTIIASTYLPYPQTLKTKLKHLIQQGEASFKALASLDVEIAQVFAQTTNKLLSAANLTHQDIAAIGSHGQTVYHQGGKYSMQIGNGAIIAEQTAITTVADFRMADIAALGQGAPLTPLYHQYLLNGSDGVVINLGGIANITIVKNGEISGFDTGPANTLLDNWIFAKKQLDYDQNGLWASQGVVDEALLKTLLADDYFSQKPPKSTGTEYFNLDWLAAYLTDNASDKNIQRTLLELSAISVANHIPAGVSVYLCGGGAQNTLLVERLAHHSPNSTITTTQDLGIHPDFVEAAAFAFFAKLRLDNQSANLPSITGAKGARILGAVHLFKNSIF